MTPAPPDRDRLAADLARWTRAWREHDLDGVLELMDESVVFEHWDGSRLLGKPALRRAWSGWFAGGDFDFAELETFVDAAAQKAVFRWRLRWPSRLAAHRGEPEQRQGLDVLHFAGGRIVRKLTYCKTTVTISGRTIPLEPPAST
jgi:ketosteroid isomerase-like protein